MLGELEKKFIQIVKASISNKIYDTDLSLDMLNKIFDLSQKNGLTSIIFSALSPNLKKYEKESSLYQTWKQFAFQVSLDQYRKAQELREIAVLAEQCNISLIFIKGPLLASLYPQYALRYSSDIDLYLSAEDLNVMEGILQKKGFLHVEDKSKENVKVFSKEDSIVLELHTRLWEDYESNAIKILEEYRINDVENKSPYCIFNNSIIVNGLEYTNHLIFLIFHMIKHFSLGGNKLSFITDIALYVNYYIDKLDLQRFWSCIKDAGYEKFTIYIFSIAKDCFNMNSKVFWGKASLVGYDDVLDDIINTYNVVDSEKGRYYFMCTIMPYYLGDGKVGKNKFLQLLYLMFPAQSALSPKYSYGKKNKFLLFVSWWHRLFSYFLYVISGNEKYKISKKFEIVDRKLTLLKKLNLIE
ncbi:MAG: hypothetical protein E7256_07510 [Lachnospiraceae bacterium]|nr:hypothetical protein [Lachnospiraceae bacterium]